MVSDYFQELIAVAEKSDLPQTFKQQVVGALRYFYQQSQCDLDRRDKPLAIRTRWLDFERMTSSTTLFAKIQREPSKWHAIEQFVGVVRVVTSPPKPPPSAKDKLEGKDPNLLFEYLARTCEAQPSVTPQEKIIMRLGLYYLFLESNRAKSQRDISRIKFAWKAIQPLLRKSGMLNEFDLAPGARRRIQEFVANRFL